jgi:PadR family transcriptional regulator PadR
MGRKDAANEPREEKARLRGGGMEEAVLRAVMRLKGQGYGVNIGEEVEEMLGRELTLGGIYTTLDRLTEKGFVEPSWGESTPERGGRRRQYFQITGVGEMALAEVESVQNRMRRIEAKSGVMPEGGVA